MENKGAVVHRDWLSTFMQGKKIEIVAFFSLNFGSKFLFQLKKYKATPALCFGQIAPCFRLSKGTERKFQNSYFVQ